MRFCLYVSTIGPKQETIGYMEHTKDLRDATSPAAVPATGQTWNTAAYATNGRFVASMASAVVRLLHPQAGERILDIGCGDGALTEEIVGGGATVVGIDASPEMVAAARLRGIDAHRMKATEIAFDGAFDAAFSNAALHWIPAAEQMPSLRAIHSVIEPGGRFVAEMGGQGNIAAIRTALRAVLGPAGIDAEAAAASFFPSPDAYRSLLEEAGFTVTSIDLQPRPTPLPGGSDGMSLWLNTFRSGVLDGLDRETRGQAVAEVVDLLEPILQDPGTGVWTADYVRLRFHATRT